MALNKQVVLISLIVALFAILNVQSSNFGQEWKYDTKANVSFGVLGPNDYLLYGSNVTRNASTISQTVNVPYIGFNINVTHIRCLESGPNQFATVSLLSPGLGYSNATVRIVSAAGRGLNYYVSFYGRNR